MTPEKVTPFEILCTILIMLSGQVLLLSALNGYFDWLATTGILFGWIMPPIIRRMQTPDTFTIHTMKCKRCGAFYKYRHKFLLDIRCLIHKINCKVI